MKQCSRCKVEKELTEFYTDSRRNSLKNPCKECSRAAVAKSNNKWRKEHREHRERYNTAGRKASLQRKYGISEEMLISMWESQNKSCAVCQRPISLSASNKASKPHVDHCHVTGVVRGLLCLTCNTGLGMFGDSLDLLDAAKTYLLQFRGVSTVKDNSDSASVSAAKQSSPTIH